MSDPFGSDFREDKRFGSAGWASEVEVAQAFGDAGIQIGFRGDNAVRVDSDAPLVVFGGAGSGKLRDLLGYIICCSPHLRKMILDPRGELAAISLHTYVHFGKTAHCFNPLELHGLPSHRCNPLSILKKDSRSLYADARFIAASLVPLSGAGGGKYFELRARDILQALLIALVLKETKATFPRVMTYINALEGDPIKLAGLLEFMLESGIEALASTAGEILKKSQESPKEFGSIVGELMAYLGFINDPMLIETLDGDDFDLNDFENLYLITPIEYVSIWAPLLNCMFTVAMILKGRSPQSDRLNMIVDESGQLGRAEWLLRSFTFGRGAGCRSMAVFQDIGQVRRNFDAETLQGFMGSAQTRLFLGVRDFETAQYVSNMLGHETLHYDDTLKQSQAYSNKIRAMNDALLQGKDMLTNAKTYLFWDDQEKHRTKQTRLLMTPSEVLNMREDSLIAFVSGLNLKPMMLSKYPYFTRPEMAGWYMPNPYHPPLDKVAIVTNHGTRWLRVITEPVPERYAHLPQYQGGMWSYIEGYRPR